MTGKSVLANAWARDRAGRFYRLFGWLGLAVVVPGSCYGAVHPAWNVLGTAVFVEQGLELWLFGSPGWNMIGRAIHGALS